MLVSRLITRTSGAASSSTGSASPHGQAKPAGRGIGPWARSARRTYARASAAYLSRSSGSPGCGRTWSTPRPVITSPHKNRVSRPSPTSPTLPGHRQHAATEDPPAQPRSYPSPRRTAYYVPRSLTITGARYQYRTAAIRAITADQAQSLWVIRFQSGLLRDRRVLLG